MPQSLRKQKVLETSPDDVGAAMPASLEEVTPKKRKGQVDLFEQHGGDLVPYIFVPGIELCSIPWSSPMPTPQTFAGLVSNG